MGWAEVCRLAHGKLWALDLTFLIYKVSGLAWVVFKVSSGSNMLHF